MALNKIKNNMQIMRAAKEKMKKKEKKKKMKK